MWVEVRGVGGKRGGRPVVRLGRRDGPDAEKPGDMTGTLAETFTHNSSSEHCSAEFNSFKSTAEK